MTLCSKFYPLGTDFTWTRMLIYYTLLLKTHTSFVASPVGYLELVAHGNNNVSGIPRLAVHLQMNKKRVCVCVCVCACSCEYASVSASWVTFTAVLEPIGQGSLQLGQGLLHGGEGQVAITGQLLQASGNQVLSEGHLLLEQGWLGLQYTPQLLPPQQLLLGPLG